jgi:hypothetical protein
MQAEIPGQEHNGYDAEPNFFEWILLLFSLTTFMTAVSTFRVTTSTTVWVPEKIQARLDENPSFSPFTFTFTSTNQHPTASHHH